MAYAPKPKNKTVGLIGMKLNGENPNGEPKPKGEYPYGEPIIIGGDAYDDLPEYIRVDEAEEREGAARNDEPPDRPPDLAANESEGLPKRATPHTKAPKDLTRNGGMLGIFNAFTFESSPLELFIIIILGRTLTLDFKSG